MLCVGDLGHQQELDLFFSNELEELGMGLRGHKEGKHFEFSDHRGGVRLRHPVLDWLLVGK